MFGMTNDASVNALELLKRDHQQVDKLFKQFEDIKEGAEDSAKEELVTQICDALTVHAQIEESIFYPAARQALQQEEGQDLLNEAAVEHQTLKDIIGRLEMAPTSDPLYDAGVKVLSEYVKHHVKEEENEIFPSVAGEREALDELGQEMEARKAELKDELGIEGEGKPAASRKPTNGAANSRKGAAR